MAKRAHHITINIRPPETGGSRQLMQFISKQLYTLGDASVKVSAADVRLRNEYSATGESKVCEIYLKVGDKNIFVIQKGNSFEESTVKSVKKLQRQIQNGVGPAEPNSGSTENPSTPTE